MGFLKSRSTSKAEKINQFQATVCEYGTAVPDYVGTVKASPNIINWADFYAQERKTTQKSGKHKHTDISYRYYVYLELALGESITDIGHIWCGSKEYESLAAANNSTEAGFPLILHKNGGKSEYMAEKYPDKAVDYKNLAYLCSKGNKWNGTYLGENTASVPSYSFEVKGQLLNTGDGIDVNPADYFLYLLKRVGIYNGTDPEETIIEGIGRFREYCRQSDLLISSKVESNQKPLHDIIEDLCELFDIYFFWSNDKFKIVVKDDRRQGSWLPDKTVIFDLGNDDFLPQSDGAGVIFSRKDSSEVYNRFTLSYLNRTNHYEEESVSYEFPDDVKERGLNQKSSIDGHWFYTKERAIKVIELQARKNRREQNKYKFALDWAYAILEPGDLVTLTDPACGLNKQIVMVESVIEAEDGVIQVEALQYEDGDYPAAIINPGGNNDNYFDYNTEPSDTDIPYIFQPPSEATFSGNELWVALKGKDTNWGGANIFIANQDANYQFLAQHRQSASYGSLISPFSRTSDEFTVNINGDFENATAEDAKNGNSMFYMDGECLSYTMARKNSDNSWTFSGLTRGQYNTPVSDHSPGVKAVFCDGSLYTIELSKKDFGRRIYFRFPSINVFGQNPQDVSEAEPYSYLVHEYNIPSIKDVKAYSRYIQTENSVNYSIQVEWTIPDLDTYAQGQVWYKKDDSGKWVFAASGFNSATIPSVAVGEKYLIAVCVEDIYGCVQQPDNAPQVELTVVTRAVTPNMPENVSMKAGKNIDIKWSFVTNADIKFYEVRTDDKPGNVGGGLLGRTTSNSFRVDRWIPRKGTIYVYAYGITNVYSQPGSIEYNYPEPPKPLPPVLNPIIGGFTVTAEKMPASVLYMNIYLSNGEFFEAQSSRATVTCKPGVYNVFITYADVFGESLPSLENAVTVSATIDPGLIENGSIKGEKLDQAAQEALSKAGNGYSRQETDNAITNAFTNFENGELKNYSTITQMNDAIQLAVKDIDLDGNELISKINLTGGEIKLDGKVTHITGDTLIDNNLITHGMLQSNSVDTNNLKAGAVTANEIDITGGKTGARTIIEENLIKVYDANGTLRVQLGVWQ